VPEPIVSPKDGLDPEHEALPADSVGLALLIVLDTLAPAERLAFVLHDMFGVPFDEIAPIVGRSPTAARQLASRARRRVHGEAPEPTRSPPPPGTVTSTRVSRCSTLTSSCGPTAGAAAKRVRRGPRREGRGRAGDDVRAALPRRAAGAHQRRRRCRRGPTWAPVLDHGLHRQGRQDVAIDSLADPERPRDLDLTMLGPASEHCSGDR